MIIQLDWFGCNPRAKWETQIHQTLEEFASLKPISRATFCVEEHTAGAPRYQLTMLLCIPGPDVHVCTRGHTFDEALLKLAAAVRKTLSKRTLKQRQFNGATCGVKANHRG
jgi:hypothetical protein